MGPLATVLKSSFCNQAEQQLGGQPLNLSHALVAYPNSGSPLGVSAVSVQSSVTPWSNPMQSYPLALPYRPQRAYQGMAPSHNPWEVPQGPSNQADQSSSTHFQESPGSDPDHLTMPDGSSKSLRGDDCEDSLQIHPNWDIELADGDQAYQRTGQQDIE